MRGLKVGFIGLGDMGAPIGRRICGAGFPLTIWARRAATVEPFRDEPNVSIAESIADVGRNSDIVGLCVFGDKDRKTLYVTAGRSLYRIKLTIPGFAVYWPKQD